MKRVNDGPGQTTNKKEKQLAKIVISEFVSLDGVVEDPAGIEGFKHGGWTFEIDPGAEGEDGAVGARQEPVVSGALLRVPEQVALHILEETLGAEALLLGRVTYEQFAARWPSRDGAFADKYNSMPKYIVSSTLEDPEWNNSKVLSGDVVEEVSRLKRELDGEIVVHGSIQLARALTEHDLVDELRLMVYPVVLGAGERLFGELGDKKPLRLGDTRTVVDGITILIYEPVRNADQGTRHVPEAIGAEAE
jgi:dihydrofolate reductase